MRPTVTQPLRPPLLRCITYDNGCENVGHKYTNKVLGTQSYFCEPFHSWEKASIENAIGLIRRFFPKKTDFDLVTKEQVKLLKLYLIRGHENASITKHRMRMIILNQRTSLLGEGFGLN
jgi:IS30 family transposase